MFERNANEYVKFPINRPEKIEFRPCYILSGISLKFVRNTRTDQMNAVNCEFVEYLKLFIVKYILWKILTFGDKYVAYAYVCLKRYVFNSIASHCHLQVRHPPIQIVDIDLGSQLDTNFIAVTLICIDHFGLWNKKKK